MTQLYVLVCVYVFYCIFMGSISIFMTKLYRVQRIVGRGEEENA